MTKTTTQEETYEKLREMIIKLELKPGQKVVMQTLMEALGVGRTPIRESLKQLQRQGLIYTVAQSGTYVSKIDMIQALQSRSARISIEKDVMVEVSTKMNKRDVSLLESVLTKQKVEFESKNISHYHNLDNEFHQACYKIAEKENVWMWINTFNTHLDRFRWLHLGSETFNYNTILKEHEELLKALKSKNTIEVQFLVIKHIHFNLESQAYIIDENPDYFTDQSIQLIRD